MSNPKPPKGYVIDGYTKTYADALHDAKRLSFYKYKDVKIKQIPVKYGIEGYMVLRTIARLPGYVFEQNPDSSAKRIKRNTGKRPNRKFGILGA